MNDDHMFDQRTRTARHHLARAFGADSRIATAKVLSNQAPLQVQGTLTDDRPYLFHARHGYAMLAIYSGGDRPVKHTVPCSETLCVDDVDESLALLAVLFPLHESPSAR